MVRARPADDFAFKHDKTGWAKDAGDGLHTDLLLLGRPRQDNGVASSCPTPRAHHGHGDKAFRRRWTQRGEGRNKREKKGGT